VLCRGEFDSRPIAVKRIINECFDLVDREVSLLRESDQHPNVIRYFCMEGDSVFHYIALELCTATLHEYVEGHKMNDYYQINEKQIIFEAISGVAHLHNLGIVHRDIKPQNVLLTVKSPNCVKALISDFGLCRKLPRGQRSFTAQSGIIGTEGWIAPEMFQDETRVVSHNLLNNNNYCTL
jgi:serine/threonine-protein kinase/endoribonuclease IRE1